jgi:uncharacterized membrane protein
MSTATGYGPVQMLVLGFDRTQFDGEVAPEFERLREAGTIRLLDTLFVKKSEVGELEVVQKSDLTHDEAVDFGAMVGALVGLGTGDDEQMLAAADAGATALEDGHLFSDEEVWFVGDAIPNGTSAMIALIEHTWAIPLRDKLVDAGGTVLADAWIHPADLVAIGAVASSGPATTGA